MWAHHSDGDQGRAGARWRVASRGAADRQAEIRRTLPRPSVFSVLQYIFRRRGRNRGLVLDWKWLKRVILILILIVNVLAGAHSRPIHFFGIEERQFQIAEVRAGHVGIL